MSKTITVALVGSLFFAGCASPQEQAKSAEDAQKSANDQAANSGDATKEKTDAVQGQADQQKAQVAAEEAAKVAAAQKDADAKAAAAAQSLAAGKNEAKTANEANLTNLEGQFAAVKPKLVKKLSKAESEKVIKDLTAKADAVRKSIADLDTATADSLEPVKATIKQRLTDYQTALDEAKKRAP